VAALHQPVKAADQPSGERLQQPGDQQDDGDARGADQRCARLVIEIAEKRKDAVQC
jgi:hypothetical protein